jgi:transposase
LARQRVFISNAERQKAYRDRLKGSHERPKLPVRTARPLSRPKRMEALQKEAEDLLSSYTAWLDSLPESLQASEQAEKLKETIDSLEQVADLLSGIDAPKGFGRD